MTASRVIAAALGAILLGIGSLGSPPAGGGGLSGVQRVAFEAGDFTIADATRMEVLAARLRLEPLWTATYDAALGSVPSSQGWTYTSGSGLGEGSVAGGVLTKSFRTGADRWDVAVAAHNGGLVRIVMDFSDATLPSNQVVAAVATRSGATNRLSGTYGWPSSAVADDREITYQSSAGSNVIGFTQTFRRTLEWRQRSTEMLLDGRRLYQLGLNPIGEPVATDFGFGAGRAGLVVNPDGFADIGTATITFWGISVGPVVGSDAALVTSAAQTASLVLDAGVNNATWTPSSFVADEDYGPRSTITATSPTIRYQYGAGNTNPPSLNGSDLSLSAFQGQGTATGRYFNLRVKLTHSSGELIGGDPSVGGMSIEVTPP